MSPVIEEHTEARLITEATDTFTVPVDLRYDAGSDPRTVHVAFPGGTDWAFGRDLLEGGMRSPARRGAIRIWPLRPGTAGRGEALAGRRRGGPVRQRVADPLPAPHPRRDQSRGRAGGDGPGVTAWMSPRAARTGAHRRPGPPSPQVTGAVRGRAPLRRGPRGSQGVAPRQSDPGQLALTLGVTVALAVGRRLAELLAQPLALHVDVGQQPVQPARQPPGRACRAGRGPPARSPSGRRTRRRRPRWRAPKPIILIIDSLEPMKPGEDRHHDDGGGGDDPGAVPEAGDDRLRRAAPRGRTPRASG